MKFYQRRAFALAVLVLCVIGAGVYGIFRKPVDLPEVSYYQWISDEGDLLSAETEQTITAYNETWNDKYYAVTAVAAVETVKGWDLEEYAYALGQKWGLGGNDMLLLVVKDDHYYVALGDNLAYLMTDTQQSKLQSAIETDYYSGDVDGAVVSFFRQADVFYAQALQQQAGQPQSAPWPQSSSDGLASSLLAGVLVLVAFFALWVALDRVRYTRYRRRVVVVPGIPYRPIFWGRGPYRPAPPRRPPPPPHRPNPPRSSGFGGGSHSSRGGFGGGSRGGRGGFGGGHR